MTNEEEFAARSRLTAEARRIARFYGLINRAPLSPPTGYSGHANFSELASRNQRQMSLNGSGDIAV